jgi:hypothetical protein
MGVPSVWLRKGSRQSADRGQVDHGQGERRDWHICVTTPHRQGCLISIIYLAIVGQRSALITTCDTVYLMHALAVVMLMGSLLDDTTIEQFNPTRLLICVSV